jgi:endonuclease III
VSARSERAGLLLDLLAAEHPDAHIELDFTTPLELLVATILSAQCTDARVNMVTPALFARCRTPADYLAVSEAELEQAIRPTGFFRQKARSIREACASIEERFDGRVPETLEELVTLHGVGRKTAAVVSSNAYGRRDGIAVDTHVGRVSRRLRLTRQVDPVKVERVLMRLYPRQRWLQVSDVLIFHGRRVCRARAVPVRATISVTGSVRPRPCSVTAGCGSILA